SQASLAESQHCHFAFVAELFMCGPGGGFFGLFLGSLLVKNFWRRARDHLIPPRRWYGSVFRAEVCYPLGRDRGGHRAVKRREFIALRGVDACESCEDKSGTSAKIVGCGNATQEFHLAAKRSHFNQ